MRCGYEADKGLLGAGAGTLPDAAAWSLSIWHLEGCQAFLMLIIREILVTFTPATRSMGKTLSSKAVSEADRRPKPSAPVISLSSNHFLKLSSVQLAEAKIAMSPMRQGSCHDANRTGEGGWERMK